MYLLTQEPKTLFWQVVTVDHEQGLALTARGVPHVYDSRAQAEAVRTRLNLSRCQRDQVVMDFVKV